MSEPAQTGDNGVAPAAASPGAGAAAGGEGPRRSTSSRWVLIALFVVLALLAVGLPVAAVLNYVAARDAAVGVLTARASQTVALYSAAARLTKAKGPADFERLAGELVKSPARLAVVDLRGRVVATSPGHPRAGADKSIPLGLDVLASLRTRGQHREIMRGAAAAGEPRVVLWKPLGSRAHLRRWMRRRGFRRWWRRWRRDPGRGPAGGSGTLGGGGTPGKGPPALRPPASTGDEAADRDAMRRFRQARRRAWRAFRRRRFLAHTRLLHVTVPMSAAEPVIAPARRLLVLGSAVSLALFIAGALLVRAARRATRAERELSRRQELARLGEMAAVMAHEIRTPLAAIKGNAQLVGERAPDDPKIDAIVSESSRLERLVGGLLSYARPREPMRRLCDPDDLVQRAAEIVAPRAREAEVDLVTDLVGLGECLEADGDQLLQVLVNLMQNAVEASEDAARDAGPGVVPEPVVARARKRVLGKVVFEVLDRGGGLDEQTKQRVFEPFFSTRSQGTGLGLAVSKQITEQHGGTITFDAREGGGTLARVVLPAKGGV